MMRQVGRSLVHASRLVPAALRAAQVSRVLVPVLVAQYRLMSGQSVDELRAQRADEVLKTLVKDEKDDISKVCPSELYTKLKQLKNPLLEKEIAQRYLF